MVLGSFAVTVLLQLVSGRDQYVLTARAKGLSIQVCQTCFACADSDHARGFSRLHWCFYRLVIDCWQWAGSPLGYESAIRQDTPVVLGTLYLP
jgi:ABC-type microcin C transport system permease subunit YejB